MSEEGRRVYVGNLDKNTAKEEVEDLFTRFGKIESLWLAKKPSGFAFVVFETTQQADDSVREMNGSDFKGQVLKVEISTSDGSRKRREGGRRESRRDRHHDERRGERRYESERERDRPRRDYYDEPPRDYDRRDYERRDYERRDYDRRDYERRDYYVRPAADNDRYHEPRRDYYDDRDYRRVRSRSGERRYYDDRR